MTVTPYVDPANLGTLTGAFKQILNSMLLGVDGMLPAQVIAVNQGPPLTVQVQPLIMVVASDGSTLSRAPIANLPVIQLGGGSIILRFPVSVGDLGYILANDRDITTFIQNGTQSPPNTYRKKNFSDSVFIPSVLRGYTVTGGDENSATLQNKSGTVAIVISETGITLRGPITTTGLLTVSAGMSVDGPIDMTSSGPITMTTPTLAVTGNITATGTITPGV